MKTWTTHRIRQSKGRQKITCLTAYDCATARIMDDAGVNIILVGDSVAMTMLGFDSTLSATMDHMLHHTAAVARGTKQAMVVADMPFMSYQPGIPQALMNAARFLQEAGADAVKLEGGSLRLETVQALTQNGIPVMAHIGLTPQSVRELGGYRVQGREPEQAKQLVADARALTEAGAFAIVLECVPRSVAATITRTVAIPTIGIGAGPDCDGQVLVCTDMLGIESATQPRFVKRYAELGAAMRQAVDAYCRDVTEGRFPGPEHAYE